MQIPGKTAGLQVGDRVAVYPIAVCGNCYFCRKGRHNLCEHEFGLAHGIEGGFAEFVRMGADVCLNPNAVNHIDEIMKITGGRGAETVIASLGIPKVIEAHLKLTRNGGTFNIFSGPALSGLRIDS